MYPLRSLIGLLLLFTMLCACPVAGAMTQGDAVDMQWKLAEHLFQKGEYYRAITEYKRFAFYFPEDPRAQTARFKILEAYVRGKWWTDGLQTAEKLLKTDIQGAHKVRVLFLQAICQVRLDRFEKANQLLKKVIDLSEDPKLKSMAQYLMGEVYAHEDDWERALDALKEIQTHSSLHGRARRSARLIGAKTPFEKKSPWLSGLLAAVIPGAGHLYLGRLRDAGLVFSVNTAFTAATVEAIQKDNAPLAGVLAAAELLWYSGNIFSAVGNAHKHNRSLRKELLNETELPPYWMQDLPPLNMEGTD